LLDFYGNDETFAADGDEFVLHGTAVGQPPQVAAQGFLDGAALFLDLAANARQFRRGLVVQSSIGLDLVAELSQEVREIDNLFREDADSVPVGLHICRRMQRDLAPFRDAIDYQDYVANLCGLERGSGDARFVDEFA